jgi:hypothetical protein
MPAAGRRIHPALFIVGAVALGGVLFVCAGVGTIGLIWLRGSEGKPPEKAAATTTDNAPHVEVDPAVTDIRFGNWTYHPDKHEMRASVTVANNDVRRWDCRVEQYDAAGKKLSSGWPDFPRLQTGETAEAKIHVEHSAAKIVIRPK